MKVVSYFSGAGGLDLGFALAGHKIIWSNDFDEKAVESYNYNIGRYLNHKSLLADIVQLLDTSKEEINKILPDCDLIIGGFPCQGFTIANLDRSMNDSRNFLYLQLLKGISVKRPPYFMLENVKGLESMEGGKILPMIMDDLENAGTKNCKFFPDNGPGYKVFYNVINALYFGVPENRERVIILGIRNDVFDDSPLKRFINFNKKVEKKYDSRKLLELPYSYSKESTIVCEKKPREIVDELYEDFINGKTSHPKLRKPSTIYKTTTLRDAIGDLPDDYSDDIPNHNGSKCIVRIKNAVGNRATEWDKQAPTIMGRGSGSGGPLIPPHPNQHRRLTVREVARIQTFPDKFIFQGSNSCGYRQIGNAVPVLMGYNLAKMFNE